MVASDDQFVGETVRVLPFEVGVISLVAGGATLAIGLGDTHFGDAIEMFFGCVG